MRRCVALLTTTFAVGVAGCGGSSAKPVSIGELQAALARHGVDTFVVIDQQRAARAKRAYSVAIPVLVRNFPWRRFAPAVAVIADRRPNRQGTWSGAVQVEAYVFNTDADAASAAGSCSACLTARNVVAVAKPRLRAQVEAALSALR